MKSTLTVLALCACICAMAQGEHASRRRNFNNENFVALREFDPVSYFAGKPQKGTSKFEYSYKGLYYYFVNDANREEFKKSPEKYEPAYGGWCAYTLANTGERVKVNPTSYRIVNGKLYLFYNFNSDNRLVKWDNSDAKKLKVAADKNWVKTMH